MSNTAATLSEDRRDEDRGKPKPQFDISVNGEPATVREERVSYEHVVAIAYPTPPSPETSFTVTYRYAKAPSHEGELGDGESVVVKKKGTSFDVTPTGKS